MSNRTNDLINVVCQIRFSRNLVINDTDSKEFISFQSKISSLVSYITTSIEVENEVQFFQGNNIPQFTQKQVKNHIFKDKYDRYILNLTDSFISLSTSNYESWDSFIDLFSKIIDIFFLDFNIFYVTRVGLRYINAYSEIKYQISTQKDWSKVINPIILGFLNTDKNVKNSNLTSEIFIGDNKLIRVVSTLGQVNNEQNLSMIVDFDIIDQNRVDNDKFQDLPSIICKLHDELKMYYTDIINIQEVRG